MVTEAALQKITAVETPTRPLARAGTGGWIDRQGFTGFVFSRQPFDALALSLPAHDGSGLALARQVYHRTLARLISARVFYRQWACIVAGAALSFPAWWTPEHGVTLYPDLAVVVELALFVLLVVSLPWVLMRGVSSEALIAEMTGVARRCFLRDIPAETPDDLSDPWRHGWLTEDCRPLSAEISEADARFRLTSVRAWWWLPSAGCLAAGATNLLFGGSFALMFVGVVAGLKLLLDSNPTAARVVELEAAEAVEAAAFVEAGGTAWAEANETARVRQLNEAIRQNREPVVRLGMSTGLLAGRSDFFAPSPGLPVGLSREDLRTHLLVFGGTGAGKTSGVLRPVARQVAAWDGTGLVVFDGKGSLPREVSDLPGMRMVDPARVTISIVKGLAPDVLVDTLIDIVEPAHGQDPFWRNGAHALLRHSAVLAEAAGGLFWNLATVGAMAANASLRQQVLSSIGDARVAAEPMLASAVEYFQYDWKEMDERTRGGIATTAQTWISTLTAHADLLKWVRATPADDEISLEDALSGGRFGVLLPAYRYGRAGAVATALLKARLYGALKRRAESPAQNAAPVVLLIDEAQEVATREDAAMLSIGRSLGLSMIAATQTMEGVIEKLGDQVAARWLNSFGSVLALQGRSAETDRFVAGKLGVTWRPRIETAQGAAVRTAIVGQAVSGALAAARKQPSLVRHITPSALQRRAGHGVLEGTMRFLRGAANTERPQSSLGPAEIVRGAELATLLAEPDTALVVLNRARVPWRDVIRLQPTHTP